MRISELLARDKITVSCEIFPPKKDGAFGRIFEVVDQINQLNVDFISVTYGAGGSTSKKTVEVASYIYNKYCCQKTFVWSKNHNLHPLSLSGNQCRLLYAHIPRGLLDSRLHQCKNPLEL